ncbi:MAG: hypothetical protein ACERKD_21105 [Prolixibacteraceae bacterium]
MNRSIAITLVLFLGTMLSCSSQKTEVQNQSSIVQKVDSQATVKWLGQWYNEGKKETLIREISREFGFKNQDLAVELTFPYQAAGLDSFADPFKSISDSIIVWAKTNTWPYDIMVCDKWFYSTVATALNDQKWGEKYLVDFKNEDWFIKSHKKYVLNVGEYMGNFGGIAPGAFLEGAWNLLYVSSEVEDKLGIKVKDLDMTIDDFIGYAQKVDLYNQTASEKITFCATNYMSMQTVIDQLVRSELGNEQNSKKVDPMQVVSKVFEKLEILAQYSPVEQYHEYISDRELKQDKALFHLHSTWVSMFWQRSNAEGEKLMRPCEYPSMTGKTAPGYSGTYNAVFVVPKNAKNREGAIRMMKFISSMDVAERWENYSKCPTGLVSRISLNEFGTDGFSVLSQHISKKYDNHLEDATFTEKMFPPNHQNIDTYALEVVGGTMTARQAIASIRQELKL